MKSFFFVPFIIIIALLTGCSDMFRVNVFRPMENTSSPVTENTPVETIFEYSKSPEFFESLKSDPEKKKLVIGVLEKAIRTGKPAEVQQASLLLADVYLNTDSSAPDVVSNVANVVLNNTSNSGTTSKEPSTADNPIINTIKALLPADLLPNSASPGSPAYNEAKKAFKETLLSLAGAGDAYAAFGLSLDPENDGTVAQPSLKVNIGDVAQGAIVCIMVSSVIDAISPDNPAGAADALFDSMFGDGKEPVSVTNLNLEGILEKTAGLQNILTAAGLDASALGFGGAKE